MAQGRKPDMIVRAKTGRQDGDQKDIFVTVGAAWAFQNGTGYNLRINSLPVPFDGSLMLVEPKDE
jgi:hypothetical protein